MQRLNGTTTLKNSFLGSHTVKSILPIFPINSTPWYLPKKKGNTPLHKNFCLNTHGRVMYNSPKCPSINKWMSKYWYTHEMEYYLVVTKNKFLLQETRSEQKLYSERKMLDTKECILYDFILMKCNRQKQNISTVIKSRSLVTWSGSTSGHWLEKGKECLKWKKCSKIDCGGPFMGRYIYQNPFKRVLIM